ncbi:MAG: phospholipid-binding protein MlaC [Aaplasma endosymbiont of Hyalomma asiaticum]
MKNFPYMCQVLVAVLSLVLFPAFSSSFNTCTENRPVCAFVEDLKAKVYEIVSTDQGVDAALELLASEVLDLKHMAKFAMGRHWKTSTAEQKERFLSAYGKYVSKVYTTQLRTYSSYRMKIMTARASSDSTYAVRVRMIDADNRDDFVTLEFQIALCDGYFKIKDVKLNNSVSLAISHRSLIDKMVEKSGIEGAIARFRQG